jgi:hypothetical protein
MTNPCPCQSPRLRAHTPRFPTQQEKDHLRTYLIHRYSNTPHSPTADTLKFVDERIANSLILVYQTPIPHSPNIMNVFWDKDPENVKVLFCYDTFVVPVPILDLGLLVGNDLQWEEGEVDVDQAVIDIFNTYVKDGQGWLAH